MKDFRFNLQLFAGEKTEKATPRKREEARKKGQVAKSNEIVSVMVVGATLLAIRFWAPVMGREYRAFFVEIWKYADSDFTIKVIYSLYIEAIILLAKMMLPILLIALVAGFVANVFQIGLKVSEEALKFDLKKLNPLSGLKRMFSKRAIAELVKALLKTGLVGYVAFSYLWDQLPQIMLLMELTASGSLKIITQIMFSVCLRILGILFVLAVADYAYQIYEFEESIKMSKQEIKDEYKRMEGDPQLKAKIKEKQRQLATRRMMQDVPKATVVVTNPTHIAIALQYDDDMGAPLVVAKGQDYVAQKIKDIAILNQVTLVENVTLARVLYKRVEIGMTVPVDLYQAVAEVIAYVYRLKKRG